MKVYQHGKKYRITYRWKGSTFNESFDTQKEAQHRANLIELEMACDTFLPPSHLVNPDRNAILTREPMTVAQLMKHYVEQYGLNHWSTGTLADNQHCIDDYIIPYIGDMYIKDVTTHQLELYYQKLQTEPAVPMKGREDENRTISISVIEKIHTIIRSALNQAIRWDYLRGANPAMAVELPKHKKESRDSWSAAEASHALNVCNDWILKLCMYLALGCSMRIGEILGLTWDCVHIESERIQNDEAYLYVEKELRRCDRESIETLRRQGRDDVFFTFPPLKKTHSTTILVLKTPKTESSVRNIYIPETVTHALEAERKHQEAVKADLEEEYLDFNLVVAQDNGRPFEAHMITQKLKALIAENDLPPVVFHSLRHSSTSLKLRISGGDIKAVQGDTGHAQANMVTDVYSHIMNDDRKHLARKMDKEFFAPESGKKEDATASASVNQLIQLVRDNPQLADSLLQLSQVFASKSS